MPFIGKDWRSPGEAWVKTDTFGWQRMKIIESQLHPGCHQSPACSWPPKSEFGRYMTSNCSNYDNTEVLTNCSKKSLSTNSESNSSDSSKSGSQSSSASSSPEKNSQHFHHHHLHPITISSPYGKYSCCVHHINESTSHNYSTNVDINRHSAQPITRSVSRESVMTQSNFITSQPRMHYNNSVSDFRISSSMTDQQLNNNNKEHFTSPCLDKMNDKIFTSTEKNTSKPILLRNGSKIENIEIPGSLSKSLESIDMKDTRPNSTLNNNCCCNSLGGQGSCKMKEQYAKNAPHCRVSVRTREVVMYNTISEAFYSLDFCNAIHDIRRFNYICKLLHLLITQNLTSLSGCATKVLFTMLEQVAWEVSENKRNIHILKNLLIELKIMIQKNYCWGRPIGSSLLWQQHFDTIERISQIVDGIDLSPPKTETRQTTFNDLPVEMVREILLRLNDYRDLINSAQASPVMRTMIDCQSIWHKLCKYHFTEQQLKMAIEQNNLFTKRGNIRGLKYARTVSADGKTSFRNPVMHKSKTGSSIRLQLEQAKSRRGGRFKDITDESKSSYVTRAIKIFDNQGNSTNLGITNVEKYKSDEQTYKINDNKRSNEPQRSQINEHMTNNSRLNQEIDWQRIFHQLRKKFDLKEEYPDCLLLCRHCRCLFWKSFGHPCIKSDELTGMDQSYSIIAQKKDGCIAQDEQNEIVEPQQSRPSVAILSRNFDDRAQRLSQNENLPPRVVNHQTSFQSRLRNDSNNVLRDRNDAQPTSSIPEKNVLVPKHVAISPQAFLKFFSL